MERFNGYTVYFELSVRGKGTSTYSNTFHTIYDAARAIANLWIDMKYRTSVKCGEFYARRYIKDDIYILKLNQRFTEHLLFILSKKLNKE